MSRERALTVAVVAKAKELGADLVGIVGLDAVTASPSHRMIGKLQRYNGVGSPDEFAPEAVSTGRPEGPASLLVFAMSHPLRRPGLDWWRTGLKGGTEGNRRLIAVQDALSGWLVREHGVVSTGLPYYVERGGVFLKDAAALAGLGVVGKNNLLVTPEFGPRVRLRATIVHTALEPTGPCPSDPCDGCFMPCRSACPRGAMSRTAYLEADYQQRELPGRDGSFDRSLCNLQMEADEEAHEPVTVGGPGAPGALIRYCRLCESACIAGESPGALV
jgi:epoxyqueuosine reductase